MFQYFLLAAIIVGSFSLSVGIPIGHSVKNKKETHIPSKYGYVTPQANEQNYQTFIDSIQATRIEENLK
jgi:hypothetical protein